MAFTFSESYSWWRLLPDFISAGYKFGDISRWNRQLWKDWEYLYSNFWKIAGEEAIVNFFMREMDWWLRSMNELWKECLKMGVFGYVPVEEHQNLFRKCQELEEKLTQREEEIKKLEKIVQERTEGTTFPITEFQLLLTKQQKEFQEMLNMLSSFLGGKTRKESTRKRS
ncbi:MAG: hypothetical protein N2317_00820 [Syntrophales bacterium]|nr:hypothetical protein [Syntrophales bacterium]